MNGFSHLDSEGRARMVDVGDKAVTSRAATAVGRLVTTAEVIGLIRADGLPKADVLATARIAGIMGGKRTSELIPLCHPLPLSSLTVSFELTENAVEISATARTRGQTGVEMEALTAVTIAGLTLHDMVKAIDPAATLTGVHLQTKSGGKRGLWTYPGTESSEAPTPRIGTALVIVASTAAAAGTRTDTTGPRIREWLVQHGLTVDEVVVVPDAEIAPALTLGVASAPAVIVTTGGTGISPTDRTPEATATLLDQHLPGIAEAIRARGAASVPTASLSRGLAGIAHGTIIVNLPGSRGGVEDGLAVLDDVLAHLLDQVAGGHRHD